MFCIALRYCVWANIGISYVIGDNQEYLILDVIIVLTWNKVWNFLLLLFLKIKCHAQVNLKINYSLSCSWSYIWLLIQLKMGFPVEEIFWLTWSDPMKRIRLIQYSYYTLYTTLLSWLGYLFKLVLVLTSLLVWRVGWVGEWLWRNGK